MADNYLEKKMEEHRNGTQRRTQRLTPAGHRPGFATLPYNVKTAFINADSAGILTKSIARAIRETGCRVAISCPDNGAALAQNLSCAYVSPGENALSSISDRWGEIELIIFITGNTVTMTLGRGTSTITKSDENDIESFARRSAELCVYLSLPDSNGRVFGEFII